MRVRWWTFLGSVLACGASLAWAAASGPDPFPTHFGLSGRPDAWSPRGEAVLQHALLAGGLAVLFAALAYFAPRLPTAIINTPRRDYWLAPEHRPAFDAITSAFMLWIGGLVLLLQAATVVVTIIDPHETAAKTALLVLFLLTIVGSVVYLVWLLTHPPKRSGPPPHGARTRR